MANKVFSEKVKRTSIALDGATRTLRVEMDLKNDDHIWRPGLYCYVVLTVARPNVLTVPTDAVFSDAGQAFCSAIVGGKIERRSVELGARSGGDVQIVSGIQDAEQLVAKDPGNYRPGQTVEVEQKAKGER
jgi:multidrug efflux pump subunit AcrA (membrane-fusion protein)